MQNNNLRQSQSARNLNYNPVGGGQIGSDESQRLNLHIAKNKAMLKKFVEVSLEMIMQDREVQTEYAIHTKNSG